MEKSGRPATSSRPSTTATTSPGITGHAPVRRWIGAEPGLRQTQDGSPPSSNAGQPMGQRRHLQTAAGLLTRKLSGAVPGYLARAACPCGVRA